MNIADLSLHTDDLYLEMLTDFQSWGTPTKIGGSEKVVLKSTLMFFERLETLPVCQDNTIGL